MMGEKSPHLDAFSLDTNAKLLAVSKRVATVFIHLYGLHIDRFATFCHLDVIPWRILELAKVRKSRPQSVQQKMPAE